VEFQPMSHEEMQRTMQFLLSQQAKRDGDLDRLTQKTDRLTDAVVGLTGIVGRVVEVQDESARQIVDLQSSVGGLHASVMRLHEIVERHLQRDHGYPSPDAL
jgi:uncharacterized protein YoxC